MPCPGLIWRHVVIGTWGSWLPGDPRGWRSRSHKKHSSGDYKHRPPDDEHRELWEAMQKEHPGKVVIPHSLCCVVGRAMVQCFEDQHIRLIALAVAATHTHLLAELPLSSAKTRAAVGLAKKASSKAITKVLPGKVWAAGGSYQPVMDRQHQLRTVRYILEEQGNDAWTWSFREMV